MEILFQLMVVASGVFGIRMLSTAIDKAELSRAVALIVSLLLLFLPILALLRSKPAETSSHSPPVPSSRCESSVTWYSEERMRTGEKISCPSRHAIRASWATNGYLVECECIQ